MKDVLSYIIDSLVDNKKEVDIQEKDENGVLHLTISVAKDDVGKVIGKGGKVIRAVRSVMKIPAIKQNKRVYVTIAEESSQ